MYVTHMYICNLRLLLGYAFVFHFPGSNAEEHFMKLVFHGGVHQL